MIITKTPFRISFAGGGTDLPEFYEREGYGAVVSVTIDKHVYLAAHPYFEGKFLLKYSQTELVDTPEEIKHPLFREALKLLKIEEPLEITGFADIPSKGSGMGSSSSFTVGLLHALHTHQGRHVSPETLAREALKIERELLKEPGGVQDQYAAAYGGLNYIRFNADGSVIVERLLIPRAVVHELEENLLLFYTGITRQSKNVQSALVKNATQAQTTAFLREMRGLADELRDALLQHDLSKFGEILHKGWEMKRQLTDAISNPEIDSHYERARAAGALGGKLLGAGGGGFLLFYVPKERQAAVRKALADLRELDFAFDMHGSRVVHVDGEHNIMQDGKRKRTI